MEIVEETEQRAGKSITGLAETIVTMKLRSQLTWLYFNMTIINIILLKGDKFCILLT